MKKIYALLMLCLPMLGFAQTSHDVTFKVNTANITVGPNGLYLGGGIIGGANAVQLTDPDGNGVYEGTHTLTGAGGGKFIFLNSPANPWSERLKEFRRQLREEGRAKTDAEADALINEMGSVVSDHEVGDATEQNSNDGSVEPPKKTRVRKRLVKREQNHQDDHVLGFRGQ